MPRFSKPIVFLGSGPVAAQALKLLAQAFSVEAVITKPRPAHHKGEVPVLTVAELFKLPTYTAANKQELDDLVTDYKFKSRLGVLVDFGIIISEKAIDSFPLGIINSHFSVLPQWRGADPITFSILSGQKSTGVSLMLLVEAMDEGPLLAYGELDLSSEITTPELTNQLIELSHSLLLQAIPDYSAGELKPATQNATKRQVSYSRKLTKADGVVDWQKPAKRLEREVRAYIGWPKSQADIAGQQVIILKAKVVEKAAKPGRVIIEKNTLTIGCGQKALEIIELQPAGKKPMSAAAFLAGHSRQLKI